MGSTSTPRLDPATWAAAKPEVVIPRISKEAVTPLRELLTALLEQPLANLNKPELIGRLQLAIREGAGLDEVLQMARIPLDSPLGRLFQEIAESPTVPLRTALNAPELGQALEQTVIRIVNEGLDLGPLEDPVATLTQTLTRDEWEGALKDAGLKPKQVRQTVENLERRLSGGGSPSLFAETKGATKKAAETLRMALIDRGFLPTPQGEQVFVPLLEQMPSQAWPKMARSFAKRAPQAAEKGLVVPLMEGAEAELTRALRGEQLGGRSVPPRPPKYVREGLLDFVGTSVDPKKVRGLNRARRLIAAAKTPEDLQAALLHVQHVAPRVKPKTARSYYKELFRKARKIRETAFKEARAPYRKVGGRTIDRVKAGVRTRTGLTTAIVPWEGGPATALQRAQIQRGQKLIRAAEAIADEVPATLLGRIARHPAGRLMKGLGAMALLEGAFLGVDELFHRKKIAQEKRLSRIERETRPSTNELFSILLANQRLQQAGQAPNYSYQQREALPPGGLMGMMGGAGTRMGGMPTQGVPGDVTF